MNNLYTICPLDPTVYHAFLPHNHIKFKSASHTEQEIFKDQNYCFLKGLQQFVKPKMEV